MEYEDMDGMQYEGEDGQLMYEGQMMGSDDEEGMEHDMMGDSYGNDGS